MPDERIQKPTLGARFDPRHPQAAGLRHAWVLNEASGRVVNDAVVGRIGSIEAGALWTPRGVEVGIDVVSASAQYADLGVIPALEGVTRFTMIARMYRASSSNFCEIQRGNGTTNRVGIHLYNDGRVYFTQATASGLEHGSFASSVTGTHTLASVFDGTQSTNATRLKGYLDGVPQVLTYGATIPAVTSAPNATLRLGQCQDGGPRSSTGSFYFLFVYDRALGDEEIAAISRDPYAPWIGAAAAIRSTGAAAGSSAEVTVADITVEADDLAATLGQLVEAPEADISVESDDLVVAIGGVSVECPLVGVTLEADGLSAINSGVTVAVASDLAPASGAVNVYPDGRVSVTWTPVSGINPITGTTLEVNGYSVAYDVEVLAGGANRLTTTSAPMFPRSVNTVDTSVSTLSGHVNTLSYSFAARTPMGEGRASAGFLLANMPGSACAISCGVTSVPPTPVSVSYSINAFPGTAAAVQYSVIEILQGLQHGTVAGVIYWIVLYSYYRGLSVGGDLAINPTFTPTPIGGNVNADSTNMALGIGGRIAADSTYHGVAVGGTVVTESTSRTLDIGGDITTGEFDRALPVGGDPTAIEARLDLEYPLTSKSIQDMEDDL